MASLNGNFNGARLKSARLYSGMTITEISNAIDISSQAISQYENGKIAPKTEVLLKLIGQLGFPREFFYEQDEEELIVGDTYFRSPSSTLKKEKQAQIERVKLLIKIYLVINKYIKFPEYTQIDVENLDLANLEIELLADTVRKAWGLGDGPIWNIIDIMEKNGVLISSFNTHNNIDAYSQVEVEKKRNHSIPVVVLGADKENAYRRQFSAAHELGHILLDDLFDIDSMTKVEYSNMENIMNRFAGSLLIPKDMLNEDLSRGRKTELKLFFDLKKKYRVSAAAIIVRANQIEAINVNQYQYLMKQLSFKGYRQVEPFDTETPVPQPRYLKHALNMIFEKKLLSHEGFFKELTNCGLTLNSYMVEELLGLEPGYFKFNKELTSIRLAIR
ncbi:MULTISPECIES: helix-turn-helix domain-containing protein [unclassified Lacrimispora]|uniref:helix-turn-helix domain-containing protein n=1 Tax=unclassified Lacrimispora TaxID=2719232 RepID=UPI003770334E